MIMKIHNRHCFSLIELLVAVVVLVVVMGFMIHFLSTSNQLWRSSIVTASIPQQAQAVFDSLNQDLKRLDVRSSVAYYDADIESLDITMVNTPRAWYGDFENNAPVEYADYVAGTHAPFDFVAVVIPLNNSFFPEDNEGRLAIYRYVSRDDIQQMIDDGRIDASKAKKYHQRYDNTIVRWCRKIKDVEFPKMQNNVRILDLNDGTETGNYTDYASSEAQSAVLRNVVEKEMDLVNAEVLATNVRSFRFQGGNLMSRELTSFYKRNATATNDGYVPANFYFRCNQKPVCAMAEVEFLLDADNGDALEDYDENETADRLTRKIYRFFNLP